MPFSIRPYLRILKLPLAYCMGFWLLITLLVLSGGPAYAEWVEVATIENGNMTVYAGPDTIRHKGDKVEMWVLFDYKTLQTSRNYPPHLSSLSQKEYDCSEERSRFLALTWYSGKKGNGEVTFTGSDEQKWEAVVPGTIGQSLWTFACGKK